MPILHLDTTQPDRLRIEAKAFQDDALRTCGAKWRSKGHDYWHISKNLAQIYRLKAVFGTQLEYDDEVIAWLTAENADWVQNALFLRAVGSSIAELDPETTQGRLGQIVGAVQRLTSAWAANGFELRPYQAAGAAMLVNSRGTVLADDPGTGKSIQGAAAIAIAQETFGDALPALVIAPYSTLESAWLKAFRLTAPGLKVMILHGTPAVRRKQLAKFVDDEYDVMVTTYGMVKAHSRSVAYAGTALKKCPDCGGPDNAKPITPEKCEAHTKELNTIPWQTIIVDEAHRIFDASSGQTRAIHGVATHSPVIYRWPMTGTAVEGSPMNWWSLLKFASPSEWGSSVAFRDTFVETRVSYLGFTEVLGLNPNTQVELRLASAPRFIRRLTSEVLPDLPEQVDIVRTVELSPKERKQYNEFKANLIVPLEGGDLFAQNPMVAFGRLMQLACSTGEINPGWTLSADGISELDFGFEPALPSSLLSEVEDARTGDYAGKRLVLYFASRKLLELYAEQLKGKGVKYSMITGTVNGADRTLAIANFNAGVTDYILLTSAGGEGISLNGCSTMFMVVQETSRIKETQARGRLHGLNRGDSNATHTEYVYFVPENTVIEGLRDAMNDKNVLADNVLGDSERMREMLG